LIKIWHRLEQRWFWEFGAIGESVVVVGRETEEIKQKERQWSERKIKGR
jgi:hypothetical protein